MSASAQIPGTEPDEAPGYRLQDEIVSYSSDFFQRYQPNTALEMVQQVPGFQLDDGSNLRGFTDSAGNILINNHRPSTKQDALSAILARIPASHVDRIDLIRGQTGSIDLQGQTVIANIILLTDADAAFRWQASLRRNFNNQQVGPGAGISLSDQWNNIDFNAGLSFRINPRSYIGPEHIFDGQGILIEEGDEDFFRDTTTGELNLIASSNVGETLLRFNTRLAYANTEGSVTSNRTTLVPAPSPRQELFGQNQTAKDLELGVDAERAISSVISARAIFLYFGRNNDDHSDQLVIDTERSSTSFFRKAVRDSQTRESIGRLELDWTGWMDHVLQSNFELAFNSVDGTLLQTENRGMGPVTVVVPGANNRVEETRWNILFQDNWARDRTIFNYGIAIERSSITSSGDDNRERSFTYIKPHIQFTYSFGHDLQLRLRAAREVAQLDFNDFISTTVFEDDDLALGNTELIPEKTWRTQIGLERRFGDLGVVTMTGFYHWITDVQDLLPVTDEFEVPGNLGDGARWGFELENTLPLEWLGLDAARLDIKARWQDSSVLDPVTGINRVLSGKAGFGSSSAIPFRDETDEYEYIFDIAFRQDFNNERFAWGWDIADRGERILFKVNELDVIDEGEPELNAFVESTRWMNIKVRVEAQNIVNLSEDRNRAIFSEERNILFEDLKRHEIRSRTKGFRLFLSLSGTY